MIQAIVPWMYIECGWSLRDKPKGCIWVGKSGARTTGHVRYGVPYRWDRLILLYLATEGARQGRIVQGTLSDITAMFSATWPNSTVLQRLLRVAHCWYEPAGSVHENAEFTKRIPITDSLLWHRHNTAFTISLSQGFYQGALDGAPLSLDIAKQLRQAELDLYLLQVSKLHRGQCADIPLFGEQGAYSILPGIQNVGTLKQRVKQYMARIRHYWPECPYWITPDGNTLAYLHRMAASHREHAPMLRAAGAASSASKIDQVA